MVKCNLAEASNIRKLGRIDPVLRTDIRKQENCWLLSGDLAYDKWFWLFCEAKDRVEWNKVLSGKVLLIV
jgi:hypothetical protein